MLKLTQETQEFVGAYVEMLGEKIYTFEPKKEEADIVTRLEQCNIPVYNLPLVLELIAQWQHFYTWIKFRIESIKLHKSPDDFEYEVKVMIQTFVECRMSLEQARQTITGSKLIEARYIGQLNQAPGFLYDEIKQKFLQ
ncbi:hypothetical protein [Risungbinella massiliensis]|uniref:hypothetical protein n=1 Tax=Risungbinella massiliensis TaxID=1329796 RepID=UPI0005CBF449|nr:hypothetical protein [Risungbinella massiliensis]